MGLFFTADLHFGHKNIIDHCARPFADVEAMNRGLVDNWNAVVSTADVVVVLGDVALKVNEVERWVPQLNGTKILIPGNHDACHWTHGKGDKMRVRYIAAGFSDILAESTLNCWPGIELMVYYCHFPYEPVDDRYPELHPRNTGDWLLHGHVHEKWKVKDKQINVGVDAWDYRPVSQVQILELMMPGAAQ